MRPGPSKAFMHEAAYGRDCPITFGVGSARLGAPDVAHGAALSIVVAPLSVAVIAPAFEHPPLDFEPPAVLEAALDRTLDRREESPSSQQWITCPPARYCVEAAARSAHPAGVKAAASGPTPVAPDGPCVDGRAARFVRKADASSPGPTRTPRAPAVAPPHRPRSAPPSKSRRSYPPGVIPAPHNAQSADEGGQSASTGTGALGVPNRRRSRAAVCEGRPARCSRRTQRRARCESA